MQPSTDTRPEVGRRSVARIRRIVVLPAPFGPSTERVLPWGSSNVTSRRTARSPNSRHRPLSSTAASEVGAVAGSSRRWTEVAFAIRLRLSQPAGGTHAGSIEGSQGETMRRYLLIGTAAALLAIPALAFGRATSTVELTNSNTYSPANVTK